MSENSTKIEFVSGITVQERREVRSGNKHYPGTAVAYRVRQCAITSTAPEEIYFGVYIASKFYGRISGIYVDEGAIAWSYNREYVDKITLSRSSDPDSEIRTHTT